MRPANPDATAFNDLSCYILAPWSNRIANAAFSFAGTLHTLRADWPDGTAIHGDVKHRAWSILDRSPVSARLAYDAAKGDTPAARNWPWSYRAEVRYELQESFLRTHLSVTNTDDAPFPVGVGFHPFWVRSLLAFPATAGQSAVVTMRSTGRYPCENMLPLGPAARDGVSDALSRGTNIDDLELDDVFAGFDGAASIAWPSGGVRIDYRCSKNLGHSVIYSPPKDSPMGRLFCLEPVSMINDGFNLLARGQPATGVTILKPGDTLTVDWDIMVSQSGE